jgi:MoaA/NifB/PqqE/SkfB family radical SAM enzyme
LHCYSSSGPERSTTLPPEAVLRSIEAANDEGFDTLAVSGGEPLMYRHLSALLDGAGRRGMVRSVTTNGTLVCAGTVEMLRERVELVALSVDGFRETHDRLRARIGAFQAVEQAAGLLRGAGITFGFIYTLTRANMHEIPDAMSWASDRGASLFQIHPLEAAGRAATEVPDMAPDTREAAIAYLLAAASRNPELNVHFDMADRTQLGEEPGAPEDSPRLADLVSPLVLEEDGMVVPLQHGFPRGFAIGNVLKADLSTLGPRWASRMYPRFQELKRALARRASEDPAALPFFNWYEAMAQSAAREPTIGPGIAGVC